MGQIKNIKLHIVTDIKGGKEAMPDYSVVHSTDPKVNAFEADLETKSGSELLDAWYDYIKYVETKHSRKKWIILMRRCILYYRKNTTFNDTVKFVKIWLNLAAALDQPELVYAKMEERRIGSSLAIFYRDWAEHCAHQGSYDEVERIIEKAEHRNAGPCHIIAKCKESLLSISENSQSTEPSEKSSSQKKINRSHYYYDPNCLSAPGTVVAYHKASVYGESYERSFEELKAKLTKYSTAKKKEKPCKSCGSSDAVKSCDKITFKCTTNNEGGVAYGNIDEDKEVMTHLNDSHSFLEDYMSPTLKPDSPSIQYFEAILSDLEVTRRHPNIESSRSDFLTKSSSCSKVGTGMAEIVTTESEKVVQDKDVNVDVDHGKEHENLVVVETQYHENIEMNNAGGYSGTPMATSDHANDSRGTCEGKLDLSVTPGANTRKIMNMFSDTLAWDPANESSDGMKSKSFDRQFEKSNMSHEGKRSSLRPVQSTSRTPVSESLLLR